MVKYANICKINVWYIKYRYHETHVYIKLEYIGQPKEIYEIIHILTLVTIIYTTKINMYYLSTYYTK